VWLEQQVMSGVSKFINNLNRSSIVIEFVGQISGRLRSVVN
jgi:hypothetical protein